MNTQPTVEVMLNAATIFEKKAKELRKLADGLSKTQDFSITGEAISICTDLSNLRIDLLSIRPVRELEYMVGRLTIT